MSPENIRKDENSGLELEYDFNDKNLKQYVGENEVLICKSGMKLVLQAR